jgi:hypothetical protein
MTKRKNKRRTRRPLDTRQQLLRKEEISIGREARHIVESAQRGDAKVVTLGKLLFFSTAEGDAWVLDPEDNLALRLAELGEPFPYRIMETATTFAVEWNAQYGLTDNGFVVQDRDGKVTVFHTYPVQHIRDGETRTRASSGPP